MRADDRILGELVGAVNGDVLPKNIVLADAQARHLAPVFQILRSIANHASGVKLVVRANHCSSGEMNVRTDAAMRSNDNILINHRVRSDHDGRVEQRFWMNNGGGMDHLQVVNVRSRVCHVGGSKSSPEFRRFPEVYLAPAFAIGVLTAGPTVPKARPFDATIRREQRPGS